MGKLANRSCDVDDVSRGTPARTVTLLENVRRIARSINTVVMQQSNDREYIKYNFAAAAPVAPATTVTTVNDSVS